MVARRSLPPKLCADAICVCFEDNIWSVEQLGKPETMLDFVDFSDAILIALQIAISKNTHLILYDQRGVVLEVLGCEECADRLFWVRAQTLKQKRA